MSYGPKRFNKVESTTHLEILEVKYFSDLPRCRNKVVGVVLEVGVARGNDLKMKKSSWNHKKKEFETNEETNVLHIWRNEPWGLNLSFLLKA